MLSDAVESKHRKDWQQTLLVQCQSGFLYHDEVSQGLRFGPAEGYVTMDRLAMLSRHILLDSPPIHVLADVLLGNLLDICAVHPVEE